MRNILIAAFTLVFLSPVAHGFEYTPDYCEFHITLPEAPSTAKACNPENDAECYHIARFTQVFALDSALNISTTCNKAEDKMLERYSGDVMTYTLQTMARDKVTDPQVGFTDHGIAKQAILIGGRQDPQGHDTIYMAQIWIGKESTFTIEGEVTGTANEEADMLLSTIMASIRHKSWSTPDDAGEKDQPTEKQEEKPNPDTKQ